MNYCAFHIENVVSNMVFVMKRGHPPSKNLEWVSNLEETNYNLVCL